MATNITTAFVQQWSAEVHNAYAQSGSKLREAVRSVSGVVGATHTFHTLGTVNATTKARDADVTPLNPAQGTVTVTLADRYAPIYLDTLDAVKTNADIRKDYVKVSADALGRETDKLIIAAADASNTPIATAAGGLTFPKLLEALEALNSKDIPMEDRFIVIGAKQLSEALQITELTSGDYQAIRAVMNGEISSALGFNWVMSNQLTLTAGTPDSRGCYAIAKSALGLAIGQDVTTEVNYIPEKASTLVNSFMSMGAATIDVEGVIAIPCDE